MSGLKIVDKTKLGLMPNETVLRFAEQSKGACHTIEMCEIKRRPGCSTGFTVKVKAHYNAVEDNFDLSYFDEELYRELMKLHEFHLDSKEYEKQRKKIKKLIAKITEGVK